MLRNGCFTCNKIQKSQTRKFNNGNSISICLMCIVATYVILVKDDILNKSYNNVRIGQIGVVVNEIPEGIT